MQLLKVGPKILAYESFAEFLKEMQIGECDLILTNECIYKSAMMQDNIQSQAQVIFLEEFGQGEPSDIMFDRLLPVVDRLRCKRIVALGGGSVIDVAKVLALDFPQKIDALLDYPQNYKKVRALIAIPTTCGTGSEATNILVVNRTRKHTKIGIGTNDCFPDQAVLISQFIKELPYPVFATSSIDALIHAVESYLNPYGSASIHNDIICENAISLILQTYQDMNVNGLEKRLDHTKDMLVASNLAGIAIAQYGCGCVHALSYAFAGKSHTVHGEANYQFFTAVLQHYEHKQPNGIKLMKLKALLNQYLSTNEPFRALEELLEKIMPLRPMHTYGIDEKDITCFADITLENQQRLLKNSYVAVSRKDLIKILQSRL